jgi:phage/plasmid-associated DNA primase
MFSFNEVGVIDSSHESIFGLQSMYKKEVILCPELSDKLVHQLSSDKFKKMVCGERVVISIKNRSAESVRWKSPMLMCGNDYPKYEDDRGSISKRLAIFSFTRYVSNQDSSLKASIMNKEISKILVKSLLAYRQLLNHIGKRGFWEVCPEYFKAKPNISRAQLLSLSLLFMPRQH